MTVGDDSSADTDTASRGGFSIVPTRIQESYLLKFTVAVAILVVFIAVLGFVAQSQAIEIIEEDTERQLVQEVNAEAGRLSEWLDSNEVPARALSDHPKLAADADTEAYLDAQLAKQKVPEEVTAIHVLNASGVIIASTDKAPGERFDKRPIGRIPGLQRLDQVKTTRPYTNDEGERVIAVRSLVVQEPGQILELEISTADVTEAFDSGIKGTTTEVIRPMAGGTEVLFSNERDVSGQVAYVADETIPPANEPVSQSSIPEIVEATPVGAFSDNPTRDFESAHVVAYTQIEGEDWVVVTHAPAANAYRLRTEIRQGFLLFLGLVLVGVVLIGGTLGRSTARDVKTLSEQATAVKNGKYDIDLTVDRRDEIGQLSESIAEMQDSLRQHIYTLEKRNEQLQVIDRVLRHDLRNDMNIIQLRAEMITHDSEGLSETYAEGIIEKTKEMLAKASKQRDVIKMLSTDSERRRVDLVSELEMVVPPIAEEYPGAEITLDLPETAPVRSIQRVDMALIELIENAVVHNDQSNPRVTISVEESNSTVELKVADNGPGLSEIDRDILLGEYEIDQLNHGSGTGLWLVYWIVDQSNGSVTYESDDPHGSIITLRFEKAPRNE